YDEINCILANEVLQLNKVSAVLCVDQVDGALSNPRIVALVKRNTALPGNQIRSLGEERNPVCFARQRRDYNVARLLRKELVQLRLPAGPVTGLHEIARAAGIYNQQDRHQQQ